MNCLAEDATEEIDTASNDEICLNADYLLVDELTDENSVTFSFFINDSVLIKSLESFKSKSSTFYDHWVICRSRKGVQIPHENEKQARRRSSSKKISRSPKGVLTYP